MDAYIRLTGACLLLRNSDAIHVIRYLWWDGTSHHTGYAFGYAFRSELEPSLAWLPGGDQHLGENWIHAADAAGCKGFANPFLDASLSDINCCRE